MRNAFIEELMISSESNEKIVLVVGDLGFSVVEPFAKRFPNRFYNSGVAEQNMMGFSAGLASEGFHVFVYSIANFPTFRCAEQIRNDVDYHNLNVTIVSVGGGLSYGNLGYSHHAIQDFALIRTMPNMLIAAPGDPFETRACVRYLTDNPQPSYLRLGKSGEACLHKKIPEINPGDWLTVVDNKNSKKIILSTGTVLELAKEWIEYKQITDYNICSMPLWGMKYKTKQAENLKDKEKVILMEDHLLDGGFGSWTLESIINNKSLYKKLSLKALDPKVCGLVGSQDSLNKVGGLDKTMDLS